MIFFQDFPGP